MILSCITLIWWSNWPFSVKVESHRSHLWRILSCFDEMCWFNWPFVVYDKSQWSHLWLMILSWITLIWWCNWPFWENEESQWVHLWQILSCTDEICLFKSLFVPNSKSQLSHLKGFNLKWMISVCFFKSDGQSHEYSHNSQACFLCTLFGVLALDTNFNFLDFFSTLRQVYFDRPVSFKRLISIFCCDSYYVFD